MQERQEALCELWSEEQVKTKPHSRLYHLEPIGVGSPMVESLTSYITRLAEAHSVYPRVLVANEILPLLNQSPLYKDGHLVYERLTSFWKRSANLNGFSARTSDWVLVLEKLTLLHELPFLTMLTWKDVLAPERLLRPTRAWCPACYQEWRDNDQVVYEPLLWAIAAIQICPKHLAGLQQCCPYPDCNHTCSWLAPRVRPGYCGICDRWLGSSFRAESITQIRLEGEERQWYQGVANVVGELLCAAPSLHQPPSRKRFLEIIRGVLEERGSNKHLLARQSQVSRKTLGNWLQKQQVPLLETLIAFSFRLESTPLDLLTENVQKIPFYREDKSRKNFTLHTSRSRPRKVDTQRLRLALEMELQKSEDPPLSMREVSQRLQYGASYLRKLFPELCHAISERHKNFMTMKRIERFERTRNEIQKAMYHLHEQGRYPSKRQVGKMLEHPAVMRLQKFHHIWLDTLRMLGLRQQETLQTLT